MPAPVAKPVAAKAPVAPPAPAVVVPVRLVAPYAYYEEDGTLKNWAHGQVITDPAEIEHLTARGARLVPHEVKS